MHGSEKWLVYRKLSTVSTEFSTTVFCGYASNYVNKCKYEKYNGLVCMYRYIFIKFRPEYGCANQLGLGEADDQGNQQADYRGTGDRLRLL